PRDVKPATDNPTSPTSSSDPKHTASPPVHKASPPPPTNTASTPPATRPRPAERTPTPVAKDPPPRDPPKEAKGGDTCDEVSCVLNNYEGACCAKFKRGGAKPAGGTGGSKGGDLPESLDRAMISDGVAKVKARVMSCGEKSPAKGQVKVSVKVSPDGQVTNVTVKNTPDANLGNCVASMMQKATFAKTQTGGSFSYPYTF
ncbi:MAG: energy transducer TonB, partial [bacterium]